MSEYIVRDMNRYPSDRTDIMNDYINTLHEFDMYVQEAVVSGSALLVGSIVVLLGALVAMVVRAIKGHQAGGVATGYIAQVIAARKYVKDKLMHNYTKCSVVSAHDMFDGYDQLIDRFEKFERFCDNIDGYICSKDWFGLNKYVKNTVILTSGKTPIKDVTKTFKSMIKGDKLVLKDTDDKTLHTYTVHEIEKILTKYLDAGKSFAKKLERVQKDLDKVKDDDTKVAPDSKKFLTEKFTDISDFFLTTGKIILMVVKEMNYS